MSQGCVAFLHAFPCTGAMWNAQAAAAREAGWRVLVPDLPGFGTKPLPSVAPSLDVVADRVAEAMAAVDEGPWVIAGVSLGGYVTMNLMRRHPRMVGAVVLCDTKATEDGPQARVSRERLAALCEAPEADPPRILEQAVLPGLLGETTRQHRPEVVQQVMGWLRIANGRSVAWYQRAMADRPDSLDVLRAFSSPAMVLWGDEDALSPASEHRLMLEAMPGAEAAVIAEAGHLANVEQPAAVTEQVVSFLARVAGHATR